MLYLILNLFLSKFSFLYDFSDSSRNFRFNILLLLLPIFYRFFLSVKNNKFIFYINKNFTRIKICILFLSFLLIHYFIISYLYGLEFRLRNLYGIFFLILTLVIFIFYRNFIIRNLEKIILIFLIFFILSFIGSFFVGHRQAMVGWCSQKMFVYFYKLTSNTLETYPSIIPYISSIIPFISWEELRQGIVLPMK